MSLSGDLVCSHQQGIYGFKAPKGFWRSLPEISILFFFSQSKDLITQSLVPVLFLFARLNASQEAVRHSLSLSDPCLC
jgi:hypothetical protein